MNTVKGCFATILELPREDTKDNRESLMENKQKTFHCIPFNNICSNNSEKWKLHKK